MTEKNSRVAIVTGSSRGIGRSIAERLASDGMSIIVNYSTNSEAALDVVAAIVRGGGKAKAFKADISIKNDVDTLFEFADIEFGGVDVVVNSAGIMILKPVAEYDIFDFDRMFNVNVRGAFLISQQAARRVRTGGSIINISTSAERQALPAYGPYAMTKGAIEALSLILARELKGREITVNAVAPGPVATELFLRGKSEELIAAIGNLNPFNRVGQPAEIADVVSFLAGPARWINGQTLYVNGGMN